MGTAISPFFQGSIVFSRLKEIKGKTEGGSFTMDFSAASDSHFKELYLKAVLHRAQKSHLYSPLAFVQLASVPQYIFSRRVSFIVFLTSCNITTGFYPVQYSKLNLALYMLLRI